jgi:hypothetical protein
MIMSGGLTTSADDYITADFSDGLIGELRSHGLKRVKVFTTLSHEPPL